MQGNVLEPGERFVQPIRLQVPRDAKPGSTHDIHVSAMLLPLVPGRRIPVGNGYTFRIRVPK